MPSGASAISGVGNLVGTGMQMFGAAKAKDAALSGYSNQRGSLTNDILYQQGLANETKGYYDPYSQLGLQGLGAASNFDLQAGVGPQVSYDKEYTDRLGAYEESPAYLAQNALAQKDLARSSHARGLDTGRSAANAQAELGQRLRATDYDKYRGDLAQRYAALQGEYGQRQQINKDRYQQIMDQIKIGQFGTTGKHQVNSGLGAAVQKDMTGLGESFVNSGKTSGAFWSGLGETAGNAIKTSTGGGVGGKTLGGIFG